jgi:GDP-D-mannose dehydratase
MPQIAFITGITGQDGSYLAELFWVKVVKFMVLWGALKLSRLTVEVDLYLAEEEEGTVFRVNGASVVAHH